MKKRARDAEAALASAEAAFVFARLLESETFYYSLAKRVNWLHTFNLIQSAREEVALVQHHDAITGTCKRHVYMDYMYRLAKVISTSKYIQRQLIPVVLGSPAANASSLKPIYELDMVVIQEDYTYDVIVQNSQSHARTWIIKSRSATASVSILDPHGQPVVYQSMPSLDLKYQQNQYLFDIYFPVTVDGFGVVKYTITCTTDPTPKDSTTDVHTSKSLEQDGIQHVDIENEHYQIVFHTQTGYIQHVIEKKNARKHTYQNQVCAANEKEKLMLLVLTICDFR